MRAAASFSLRTPQRDLMRCTKMRVASRLRAAGRGSGQKQAADWQFATSWPSYHLLGEFLARFVEFSPAQRIGGCSREVRLAMPSQQAARFLGTKCCKRLSQGHALAILVWPQRGKAALDGCEPRRTIALGFYPAASAPGRSSSRARASLNWRVSSSMGSRRRSVAATDSSVMAMAQATASVWV